MEYRSRENGHTRNERGFILQGYPPLPGFQQSCLMLPGLSWACAGQRQTTGIFGRQTGSSWRASGATLPKGSPVLFRSGIKFIQSFCQPMLRLCEYISGRPAFLSHSFSPSVNRAPGLCVITRTVTAPTPSHPASIVRHAKDRSPISRGSLTTSRRQKLPATRRHASRNLALHCKSDSA